LGCAERAEADREEGGRYQEDIEEEEDADEGSHGRGQGSESEEEEEEEEGEEEGKRRGRRRTTITSGGLAGPPPPRAPGPLPAVGAPRRHRGGPLALAGGGHRRRAAPREAGAPIGAPPVLWPSRGTSRVPGSLSLSGRGGGRKAMRRKRTAKVLPALWTGALFGCSEELRGTFLIASCRVLLLLLFSASFSLVGTLFLSF